MITNLKSKSDISVFALRYFGSTNVEKQGQYGISHLVEHLVCEPMSEYENDFIIDGITFNAWTDVNDIVFYVAGLEEQVQKYRQILYDKITGYKPVQKDFDKEIKIVIEEYSDSFNSQSAQHTLNILRKEFNHYSAIGELNSLKSITLNDVAEYINNYMGLPHEIINISNKDITGFETKDTIPQRIINPIEYIHQKGTKSDDKTSLLFYTKNIDLNDVPYVKLICRILTVGLKSPLYDELREKRGLCYSLSMSYDQLNYTEGLLSFDLETSNENKDLATEVFKEVIDNRSKYINEKRFNDIVSNVNIIDKKRYIDPSSNMYSIVVSPKKSIFEKSFEYGKMLEIYDKYFNSKSFTYSYSE